MHSPIQTVTGKRCRSSTSSINGSSGTWKAACCRAPDGAKLACCEYFLGGAKPSTSDAPSTLYLSMLFHVVLAIKFYVSWDVVWPFLSPNQCIMLHLIPHTFALVSPFLAHFTSVSALYHRIVYCILPSSWHSGADLVVFLVFDLGQFMRSLLSLERFCGRRFLLRSYWK